MRQKAKKLLSFVLAALMVCSVAPLRIATQAETNADEPMLTLNETLASDFTKADYFNGTVDRLPAKFLSEFLFSGQVLDTLVSIMPQIEIMTDPEFGPLQNPVPVDVSGIKGDFTIYLNGNLPANANEAYRPSQLRNVFADMGIVYTPADFAEQLVQQDPAWADSEMYQSLTDCGSSWIHHEGDLVFDWGLEDGDYNRFIKVAADVIGANRPLFETLLFNRNLSSGSLPNLMYLYSPNVSYTYNLLGEHTIKAGMGLSLQSGSLSMDGVEMYREALLPASEMLFAALGKEIVSAPVDRISDAVPFADDLCDTYANLSDEALANAIFLPLKVLCDTVNEAPTETFLAVLPTIGLILDMCRNFDAPTALNMNINVNVETAKIDTDSVTSESGVTSVIVKLLSRLTLPLNTSVSTGDLKLSDLIGLEDTIGRMLLGVPLKFAEQDLTLGQGSVWTAGTPALAAGLPDAVFSLQNEEVAESYDLEVPEQGSFYYIQADPAAVMQYLHRWLDAAGSQQFRNAFIDIHPGIPEDYNERLLRLRCAIHPTAAPCVTVETVPAGCEQDGGKTARCSLCDFNVAMITEAATGHSFTFTPNGDGTHTGVCAACGATVTDDCGGVPIFTEVNVDTYEYTQKLRCAVCGGISEVSGSFDVECPHSIDRYFALGNGMHIAHCDLCGLSFPEECPFEVAEEGSDEEYGPWTQYVCECGDSYTFWSQMTAPAGVDCFAECRHCTFTYDPENPGTHIVTCIDCGRTWTEDCSIYTENSDSLLSPGEGCLFCDYCVEPVWKCDEHEWEQAETVEPTCARSGYTLYVCVNCGAQEKRDVTEPTGAHTYQTTKTVAPTCKAQGYTLKKCTVCGATKKDDIKPTVDHLFTEKKNDVAPTCTKSGYIDYACKYCGLQKRLRTKDPLGHHYTRTVLVQPTEKTTGIARYKCSRCGDTYRVTLPVHKHKYREIDRSLPCKFYNTQITYRCVECGKQIEKTGGKGEGHTVINGVCVVCGLAAGTGAIQNEALLSTPFAPLVIIFDRVVAILHVFRDSGLTAKSISIIRSWPPLTDVLRAFRNR